MNEAVRIEEATGPGDLETIGELFREYEHWLGVDLCFQDFEAELAGLPGIYALSGGSASPCTHGGEGVGMCCPQASGTRHL